MFEGGGGLNKQETKTTSTFPLLSTLGLSPSCSLSREMLAACFLRAGFTKGETRQKNKCIKNIKYKCVKKRKETKKGKKGKEGRKEGRKVRSQDGRKVRSQDGRKEGRKEGTKPGSKEGTKPGSQEGKEGRKEARKEGRKEARKQGRWKEGLSVALGFWCLLPLVFDSFCRWPACGAVLPAMASVVMYSILMHFFDASPANTHNNKDHF